MILLHLAERLRRVRLGGCSLNGLLCAGAVSVVAEIVVISICLDIHLYLWIADVHYRIFRVRHIVRDGGVDGHGYRRKAADDPHHQCRAEQDACRNEDDAFCFLCHNRTPFLVRVDNPSSYPEHTTALCGSPPQETESIKTLEYTWLPPSDLCL